MYKMYIEPFFYFRVNSNSFHFESTVLIKERERLVRIHVLIQLTCFREIANRGFGLNRCGFKNCSQ